MQVKNTILVPGSRSGSVGKSNWGSVSGPSGKSGDSRISGISGMPGNPGWRCYNDKRALERLRPSVPIEPDEPGSCRVSHPDDTGQYGQSSHKSRSGPSGQSGKSGWWVFNDKRTRKRLRPDGPGLDMVSQADEEGTSVNSRLPSCAAKMVSQIDQPGSNMVRRASRSSSTPSIGLEVHKPWIWEHIPISGMTQTAAERIREGNRLIQQTKARRSKTSIRMASHQDHQASRGNAGHRDSHVMDACTGALSHSDHRAMLHRILGFVKGPRPCAEQVSQVLVKDVAGPVPVPIIPPPILADDPEAEFR